MGMGNFWRKGRPSESIGTFCRVLCKMTEPIDVPFGLWTRVGRRKHIFNRISRWRQCALIEGRIGATWRTKPSVCCGDAAFCPITLTTCYYILRES